MVAFKALFILSSLQVIHADDLARCTDVRISPQKGICSDYVFNSKVCTGSSSWFKSNSSALLSQIDSRKNSLEAYSWSDFCRLDITAKCRTYLPSTKVQFFRNPILENIISYFRTEFHISSDSVSSIRQRLIRRAQRLNFWLLAIV